MEKEKDKAYAHAEKAYMQGQMFPFIRVGMQKVDRNHRRRSESNDTERTGIHL